MSKQCICVFLWSFCFILLFNTNALAESHKKTDSTADIRLSTVIPVVQQKLTITLLYGDRSNKQAPSIVSTIISGDGNVVYKHVTVKKNNHYQIHWTPKKTGFFTVIFSRDNKTLQKMRFPVVWRPLYFVMWPPPSLKDATRFPYLTSTVFAKEQDIQVWQKLGRNVLGIVYYRDQLHLAPALKKGGEDAAIQALVKRWSDPLDKDVDGIFIDEFGEYATAKGIRRIKIEAKALQLLRKRYPNTMIFVAQGGAPLREAMAAYKSVGAVALMEYYPEFATSTFGTLRPESYLKCRIRSARNADLIFERGYGGAKNNNPSTWKKCGAIILLSLNHVGTGLFEEPTVERLEMQVRRIKRLAPAMPGIGFYGLGSNEQLLRQAGLFRAAEKLIQKYYIKPVVSIHNIYFSDYPMPMNEGGRIYLTLNNSGGMAAKNIRIKVYAKNLVSNHTEQIGTIRIDKLGTGFRTLHQKNVSSPQPVQYQQFGGDRYAVSRQSDTIFLARSTVSLAWNPTDSGPYQITAAIEQSNQFTVLDDIATKNVVVVKGNG